MCSILWWAFTNELQYINSQSTCSMTRFQFHFGPLFISLIAWNRDNIYSLSTLIPQHHHASNTHSFLSMPSRLWKHMNKRANQIVALSCFTLSPTGKRTTALLLCPLQGGKWLSLDGDGSIKVRQVTPRISSSLNHIETQYRKHQRRILNLYCLQEDWYCVYYTAVCRLTGSQWTGQCNNLKKRQI